MKNRLLVFVAFLLVLASCKKDENKIYYESGTAPTLTAAVLGSTTLVQADAAKNFLKLNWTNPNYRFTTGISSQDVNYILQVDTTGANFTSPAKYETSIAKDLGITYTVNDFNQILAKMNLQENIPHNLDLRVKAALGNNAALPLYSNVYKLTVTPYLDVAVPVPANGNLWIVGDATANGWDNPLKTQYEAAQKFTKVSTTLYELVLPMPGGGNYKLLQDNGVWGTQYHMVTGTWESGTFEKKDSDPGFPGPPSAGTYKISVNFKTGKYTVVKQ